VNGKKETQKIASSSASVFAESSPLPLLPSTFQATLKHFNMSGKLATGMLLCSRLFLKPDSLLLHHYFNFKLHLTLGLSRTDQKLRGSRQTGLI